MRRTKQRLAFAAAVLGLSLAGAAAATAQQPTGTVVGQVTDAASMKPLASSQVFVPGTQRGALTNADGRFVISQVPTGQRTVKVTVLGYAEGNRVVTVTAGGSATVNFALAQSAVELNAVVVSAVTGTAERRSQIGANVTNISVADLNKGAITKFSDVLNGRAAGIQLQGVNGATGASQKIRIRGANSLSLSNEPIIIVDGVTFNSPTGSNYLGVGGQDVSRLNDINPEDIANIEVLKGPAASSMYGTAAANGVLLITTKRGRAGKATWHAYAETGSLKDNNTYPINYLSYHVITPGAPLTTSAGALDKTARVPCFNFNAALAAGATGACVQDSVMSFDNLRDPRTTPFVNGNTTRYGASVAGGTDAATYYVSLDKTNEEGVIGFNTNRRVDLRSNLDAHVRDNLDLSVSASYTTGSLARPNNDNSIFSPLINGLMGGAFFFPDVGGKTNFRNFGFNYGINDVSVYPVFEDVNHFVLGTRANYRPLRWLSANWLVGLDLANTHEYSTLQPNGPLAAVAASYAIGRRQSNQADNFTYTTNGSATANFDLMPELNSQTTAGVSYQKNHLYSTYGFGAGFPAGTANLGATSSLFSVDEQFSELIQVGAFGQEKLAWKDRVFLTGSIRTDDNSAFGTRFGRIAYPAASASWLVSQEPFFPKLDWLNTLRLRTAWGTSGLRPNFRQAITYYAPVATTVSAVNISSVTLSATGNENLKPERTTELEAGADLGLFTDRLSAEFTYFRKQSRDALISKPLPPSLGLTASQFDNLGKVQNSGTELSLNALAVNLPNARLNVRLAATTLQNKILDMSNLPPIVFGRGNQKHQQGFSAGSFWQKQYTYDDANHDGLLSLAEVQLANKGTAADTTVMVGPSLPTFSRTVSGDLTLFKFITLSTLFDWRGGNYQLNFTEAFRCSNDVSLGDRGCSANMNAHASLSDQARFIANRFLGTTYGYIEKADFVKWREMSVTVGVPSSLAERVSAIRGASITLAGRNLHTWTKYSGIDPEINESGAVTGTTGGFVQDEFNTQPPVRYYTLRLNFTF